MVILGEGALQEDALKDTTKGVDQKGYSVIRLPTTSKIPEKVKMVLYNRHRGVQASVRIRIPRVSGGCSVPRKSLIPRPHSTKYIDAK